MIKKFLQRLYTIIMKSNFTTEQKTGYVLTGSSSVSMQKQIDELKKQVIELNSALVYLAGSNLELARDMKFIHESLEQIIHVISGPDDMMSLPLFDDPDDGLLN